MQLRLQDFLRGVLLELSLEYSVEIGRTDQVNGL
jgi:hypothetical protein